MFRELICPSSGVCDYVVELPHWLISFLVCCLLELGCGSARVVSGLLAEASIIVRYMFYKALDLQRICVLWGKKVLMTYENRASGRIFSSAMFQEVHAIHMIACWDLTPPMIRLLRRFGASFCSTLWVIVLGLCGCWNNLEEQKCQLYRKVRKDCASWS